ncbi:Thermostable hemolysin [Marinomonas aquimarina]|uniref:Thermostable hemolysin n=1 Tax=Marinomonas aquimarina TaxID=295068 RepID=A0A1A8T6Q3_9GAMM|nr:thermostable hemolysin [Marinomonas aquimarina]SBS26989.1 Thermostable hemolysin [Marinomonas aquimarina]
MQESLVVQQPVKANRLQGPQQAFEFVTAAQNAASRDELEAFIKAGFAKCYDANLQTFLPLLLGIKTKQLRAAVGVRRADVPLFIEQYLPDSITQVLAKIGIFASRHQIAEMGNLYSQSARFTLPLIMTVVMGLYLTDVRHLVFSGTAKVRELLTALGFPMRYLAPASVDCIAQGRAEWGHYYDNEPEVLVLDIEASIKVAYQRKELHGLMTIVQNRANPLLASLRNL